jgi:hypothetical protein
VNWRAPPDGFHLAAALCRKRAKFRPATPHFPTRRPSGRGSIRREIGHGRLPLLCTDEQDCRGTPSIPQREVEPCSATSLRHEVQRRFPHRCGPSKQGPLQRWTRWSDENKRDRGAFTLQRGAWLARSPMGWQRRSGTRSEPPIRPILSRARRHTHAKASTYCTGPIPSADLTSAASEAGSTLSAARHPSRGRGHAAVGSRASSSALQGRAGSIHGREGSHQGFTPPSPASRFACPCSGPGSGPGKGGRVRRTGVPCHRINDLGCPSGMGRQQYADRPRCKPVCLSSPHSAGVFELGKPFGAGIVHSVDSESRPTRHRPQLLRKLRHFADLQMYMPDSHQKSPAAPSKLSAQPD